MIREYHQPESIELAVDLFRKHQGRACYMGGGAQINAPDSGAGCDCAVSLAGLGLESIATGRDDVIIGACATLQSVADHPDMPQALREAAGFLRSRHMRNQHTVGGDIAARKHDSFTAAALMALQATVQTADQGQMSVEEYVSGASDALILSVTVPAQGKRICALFRQTRAQRGPLLMNMAVGRDHDGGNPIIAVSGAGIGLTRLPETEALLASGADSEQIARQAASEIAPTGHWLGSDDYFRHLCGAAAAHCIGQHA
jgi:putative selenate reductase FAD-binding subunit